MKCIWRLLASQTKVRASAIKVIAAVWLLMSQASALTAQDLTGTTEGVFSVSPTGAFNYTIPIKVLDGYSNGWETGVWLNNCLVWKLESETDLGKVPHCNRDNGDLRS